MLRSRPLTCSILAANAARRDVVPGDRSVPQTSHGVMLQDDHITVNKNLVYVCSYPGYLRDILKSCDSVQEHSPRVLGNGPLTPCEAEEMFGTLGISLRNM